MKDFNGNQIQIDFTLTHPSPLEGEGKGEGDLTNEELRILQLLMRGRQNALSVRYLAAEAGLSEVELRQVVRHLIMEHGVLIASSVSNPNGFYIASNENEIREATRSLRHRGIMILMRAAKLQKISLEEIFHQARIEYGG